jgi:hypothetical protein
VTNNSSKTSKFYLHQGVTPLDSWVLMTVYWLGGAVMASWAGLWELLNWLLAAGCWLSAPLFSTRSPGNQLLVLISVIITVGVQIVYYLKTPDPKRRLSRFTGVVFPVCNGIFETILFILSFDIPAKLCFRDLPPVLEVGWTWKHILQFIVGFTTFCIYSGLIHALFWVKWVFPPHPKGMPPRHRKSKTVIQTGQLVPMLTVMSLAWFLLYYIYQDVWIIVACHMIVDLFVHASEAIPAPWDNPLL